MKWMLVAMAVMGLSGCMQVNTKPLDPSVVVAGPGKHVITIERDTWLPGYNSMPVTIFVDGKPAREIGGGKTLDLYVPDGRHSIGVAMGRKATPEREIAVDVSASESPILRASIVVGGYGGYRIERVK